MTAAIDSFCSHIVETAHHASRQHFRILCWNQIKKIMNTVYHILNGDCLKEQFPSEIEGEIIVARECLVDGDVKGDTAEELFDNRASFIAKSYEGFTEADYYNKTVAEFNKMMDIPAQSVVNLWFEEDLFCQVNLWFVLYLLKDKFEQLELHLVMPPAESKYGFGGLNQQELAAAYKNKRQIDALEFEHLKLLWTYYQANDFERLKQCAEQLKKSLPLLEKAIEAQIDRYPRDGSLGRPENSMLAIMEELKTNEFGPVFREFCERESIYGFGDLQVMRIWEQLKKEKK
jgi:hypothetical protein